ncbi:glucose-6-phosphate 1-dehydrogenase [Tannerella sp. oral taxon BU063 isolate Cell 6/7/9]|uniref:Glucose-6-phosphate 1-dehydrogenase n=1 Tax=Tannerella sp. oral taxon BU063 isolate Cell 6/7/9 TaxID=1411021 RepID=W2CUE9_9BACT|nr:glucose-6-phosphate 1-dehydrogenase [Tannerella sp. oral taxon BU063 isolate Cell 6/7/9]
MEDKSIVSVIFGASGDLTWRKLVPALYDMYYRGLLPGGFKVLGVGRAQLTDESFREKMKEGLDRFVPASFVDQQRMAHFLQQLHYHAMDTNAAKDYEGLRRRLGELSQTADRDDYLYYFAMPPFMYAPVASYLHTVGLTRRTSAQSGFRRVIIEKPFGHDAPSAANLNRELLRYFSEDQIYRIDHYLGKEAVQNMLVMRFSNGIFEPLWNRNYVEYVEITSSEALGVGSRAGYYESAGALRDMVQNHLLQLLAIGAMDPPVSSDANAIRNEMLKVFLSLRRMTPEQVPEYVIRGQYTGAVRRGEPLRAYREEKGVAPESKTETFVAMKCYIDNWRWSGVPFYIRTGKCLPTRVTEVVVHFRPNPHHIFARRSGMENVGNQLVLRIQPDEGILLRFGMKVPGAGFHVDQVSMDFHYSSLGEKHIPDAYERLLSDCMMGDATLYQRGDAVEATWQYVQPILDAWASDPTIPLYGYPAGSWGPEQADTLLATDGHAWRYPCKNLTSDDGYCEL